MMYAFIRFYKKLSQLQPFLHVDPPIVDTLFSNNTQMMKYCRKSCANYNRSREKYDFFTVSDDEESFFELSAKTVTGETLNFERFEGYVTMVINMAKLCKSVNPNAEIYFAHMEDLQKVWPYSFELIVFPFEHPKFDYANEDCADFEEAARRPGRSIHVMETANIHVPVEELHPVYKYMMGKAKFDKLDVDVATFFVVNPEGSRVEVHQGTSLTSLKRYLHRMFETEL